MIILLLTLVCRWLQSQNKSYPAFYPWVRRHARVKSKTITLSLFLFFRLQYVTIACSRRQHEQLGPAYGIEVTGRCRRFSLLPIHTSTSAGLHWQAGHSHSWPFWQQSCAATNAVIERRRTMKEMEWRTHTHTHAHTHTHTHTHTHAHTERNRVLENTHTHTHTHTQGERRNRFQCPKDSKNTRNTTQENEETGSSVLKIARTPEKQHRRTKKQVPVS